jgi:hypothetical protein
MLEGSTPAAAIPLADRGMAARARAARELVARGDLDPGLALSHVLWPGKALAELSATSQRLTEWPDELRLRALELVDSGLSQAKAGAAVSVPRSTVQMWVRQRRAAAVA